MRKLNFCKLCGCDKKDEDSENWKCVYYCEDCVLHSDGYHEPKAHCKCKYCKEMNKAYWEAHQATNQDMRRYGFEEDK